MKEISKQEVICWTTLLLYWMILMIFRGKQQKPVTRYCYVKWSKARLLVGLKQKKIDQIRRANAQRHVSSSFTNTGGQKLKKKQSQTHQKGTKSMSCVYFNNNSYTFNKYHETKGAFYRHICSSCFTQEGKVSTHSASDCKKMVKNE